MDEIALNKTLLNGMLEHVGGSNLSPYDALRIVDRKV